MNTYLVGGAVRDQLLGLPVVDRDWVVVGSSVQDMLNAGFKQVGRDFPVFLHPTTHEEYALARTERKISSGYRGFSVHADPDVTLEEDLQRRDLTINAIAQTPDGEIIDPYGGQTDLQNRLLKHVSPAFAEDPVRVLRVARFAARFAEQGFVVAPETMQLMQNMVANGEVDALVPERVWQEMQGALNSHHPGRFIETLKDAGALQVLIPELDKLFGVPQPKEWHPEIDTGTHVLMVLQQIKKLNGPAEAVFACLCHDLGKGLTHPDNYPSHRGHEESGVELVQNLCTRFRVPNEYRDLAILVCRYHTHVHRALELNTKTMLKTLLALDGIRKPARFEQFILSCEADARGRLGLEQRDYPQAAHFRKSMQTVLRVDAAKIAADAENPAQIKELLHRARLDALNAAGS